MTMMLWRSNQSHRTMIMMLWMRKSNNDNDYSVASSVFIDIFFLNQKKRKPTSNSIEVCFPVVKNRKTEAQTWLFIFYKFRNHVWINRRINFRGGGPPKSRSRPLYLNHELKEGALENKRNESGSNSRGCKHGQAQQIGIINHPWCVQGTKCIVFILLI